MIREFKNHKTAYSVLTFVLFVFILLFLQMWPDRVKQRIVILSMSLFYFVWGVVVHRKINHISKKIIWEYLAVAFLAGSILFLLTF
mgnify:FL=1|jgi:hypothetical protein